MPRRQASPSSHCKTPFPQTLKKYVGGAPSPVPSDGRVVSGWEGVGMVLEGGYAQDRAFPSLPQHRCEPVCLLLSGQEEEKGVQ